MKNQLFPMRKAVLAFSFTALVTLSSFLLSGEKIVPPSVAGFSMSLCKTGHGGEAHSGDLYMNGNKIGNVIALNRASQRIKAKYFAYKDNGTVVHDRYVNWRSGKNIVLISSGAYGTTFSGTDKPVGLTMDNGNDVNLNLDPKMDGLIIVEAVGGIRASNIQDGDLTYKEGGADKTVNIKDYYQRNAFLSWCRTEKATTFQTHLLIYKNQLKFKQSGGSVAERKLLVLTKDASGNVFHFIIYSKEQQFTLYDMAYYTLQMFTGYGHQVIAAANLDTGGVDILATSTELYDCSNGAIEGKTNNARNTMTNMLAYYYE